jgi:hypothetical protein
VPANVVLNALATFAPGALAAISSAAEPASSRRGSNASTSIGLVMSTTTLSSSWSP